MCISGDNSIMCLSQMIAQNDKLFLLAARIIKCCLEVNLVTQIKSQTSPKCPCLAH